MTRYLTSSSDSDDQEEQMRLREASLGFSVAANLQARTCILKDDTTLSEDHWASVLPPATVTKRPSLRTDLSTDNQETLIEGITPEFQNFLGKKLLNHLEIQYDDVKDGGKDHLHGKKTKESQIGVKLFSSSKVLCTSPSENDQHDNSEHQSIRRCSFSSEDSEAERSRLLEASVTPESIFHFSATGEYASNANEPPTRTKSSKKHKDRKISGTISDNSSSDRKHHSQFETEVFGSENCLSSQNCVSKKGKKSSKKHKKRKGRDAEEDKTQSNREHKSLCEGDGLDSAISLSSQNYVSEASKQSCKRLKKHNDKGLIKERALCKSEKLESLDNSKSEICFSSESFASERILGDIRPNKARKKHKKKKEKQKDS